MIDLAFDLTLFWGRERLRDVCVNALRGVVNAFRRGGDRERVQEGRKRI